MAFHTNPIWQSHCSSNSAFVWGTAASLITKSPEIGQPWVDGKDAVGCNALKKARLEVQLGCGGLSCATSSAEFVPCTHISYVWSSRLVLCFSNLPNRCPSLQSLNITRLNYCSNAPISSLLIRGSQYRADGGFNFKSRIVWWAAQKPIIVLMVNDGQLPRSVEVNTLTNLGFAEEKAGRVDRDCNAKPNH